MEIGGSNCKKAISFLLLSHILGFLHHLDSQSPRRGTFTDGVVFLVPHRPEIWYLSQSLPLYVKEI